MIIVLEGTDGTGKSTVGKQLAEKLGGVYFPTPPEKLKAERTKVDAEASDLDHYKYYVKIVQDASLELRSMPGNIVVDRFWMSTVAYHRTMGLDAKKEDFGDILEPDVTVFLEASPAVQAHRKDGRGWTPGDRRMEGRGSSILEEYSKLLAGCPNVVRINTDTTLPEDVVAAIIAAIGPRLV